MEINEKEQFYLFPGDELASLRKKVKFHETVAFHKSQIQNLESVESQNDKNLEIISEIRKKNEQLENELSCLRKSSITPRKNLNPTSFLKKMTLPVFNKELETIEKLIQELSIANSSPELSTVELIYTLYCNQKVHLQNCQKENEGLKIKLQKYESQNYSQLQNIINFVNQNYSPEHDPRLNEDTIFRHIFASLSTILTIEVEVKKITSIFKLDKNEKNALDKLSFLIKNQIEKNVNNEIDAKFEHDNQIEDLTPLKLLKTNFSWISEQLSDLQSQNAKNIQTIEQLTKEKNLLLDFKVDSIIKCLNSLKNNSGNQNNSQNKSFPSILKSEIMEEEQESFSNNSQIDAIVDDLSPKVNNQPFDEKLPIKNQNENILKAQKVDNIIFCTPKVLKKSILGQYVDQKSKMQQNQSLLEKSLISTNQGVVINPQESIKSEKYDDQILSLGKSEVFIKKRVDSTNNTTLKYLTEIDQKNEKVAFLEKELESLKNITKGVKLESENKLLSLKVNQLERELELIQSSFAEEKDRLERTCNELVNELTSCKINFSQFVLDSEDRITTYLKKIKSLSNMIKAYEKKYNVKS